AVYAATKDAIERAARGDGATLIETLTYRMSGHSTSDDPKAYRKDVEVETWKGKDPLARTRLYLEKKDVWDAQKQTKLEEDTASELQECVKIAEKTPLPSLASMFEDVFAEKPWHLKEQQAELVNG